MLPAFLVPETKIHENGTGPGLAVPDGTAAVLITLGIKEVVEQQSLQMGIHSSIDGAEWETAPLIEFPEKFYPGLWSVLMETDAHTGVKYVRAQWKVNRWGRGSKTPSFELYVFAEAIPRAVAEGPQNRGPKAD